MRSNILGRVGASMSAFTPRSVEAVAALYLARRFNDLSHVRDYARAIDRSGLRAAAEVYREVCQAGNLHAQGERFRAALQSGGGVQRVGFPLPHLPIIALRVERRAICLAVFFGSELHYTQVRDLSDDPAAAQTSASGFVRWCLAHFPNGVIAIEEGSNREATRGQELGKTTVAVAREGGVPVWEVTTSELIEGFSEPPMRTRAKFRDAVAVVCPPPAHDEEHRALLDAIGLGLLVSVKRTFGDTEPGVGG